MLNQHAEPMYANVSVNANQDALINDICASMGARYHDPILYEYGNVGTDGNIDQIHSVKI